MRGSAKIVHAGKITYKYHKTSAFENETRFWLKAAELEVAPPIEVVRLSTNSTWYGYLKMETLTPFMKELKLSDRRKRKVGRHLYQKIKTLHENNIAHRDLHMGNVVMKDDEPFVIDWEFATEVNSEVSYDFYGDEASGVPRPKPHTNSKAIYWDYTGARSLRAYFGSVEVMKKDG